VKTILITVRVMQ